jgi:hypothetical protein
LIDQVLFNSAFPSQQMAHEQFGKVTFIANGSEHRRLFQARDHAFIECSRRSGASRLAVQTRFAEKVSCSQNCNDRVLAVLGDNGELDLALLNVKNRVRGLSLRDNNLIVMIVGYRSSLASLSEKSFGIK